MWGNVCRSSNSAALTSYGHCYGADIGRGECNDLDTVRGVGYECSTHAQHQQSMKSGSDIIFGEGASENEGGGTGDIAILLIHNFAAAPGEERTPASCAKLGETWCR